MDSSQFKDLAHSKYGDLLRDYLKDLISDVVDVRTIEDVNEVEILARKRASEIIEERLLDRLSDRGRPEPPKSEFE